MKKDLFWTTEKRRIKDLKDHPKNPRQITKQQMEKLKESLDDFNYVELVAINLDNTILAGHMRTRAMKAVGRGKEEIEVRVPNRMLTDKEAENYLIGSNLNTGDWDYDILSTHWDMDELINKGFKEKDFMADVSYGNNQTSEDTQTNLSAKAQTVLSNDEDDEDDEELEGREYDESITDNLNVMVRFVMSIPEEDSTSLKNQLTDLLRKFPRCKMEEKK